MVTVMDDSTTETLVEQWKSNNSLPSNTTTAWFGPRTIATGGHVEEGPLFTLTEEQYDQFAFVINVVATPIICGLGLIGNVLGVGVLWRGSLQHKLTIYIYLCALTFVDSIYLFFGVLRSIPNVARAFDKYLGNLIDEHMKLVSIYIDMVLTYTATFLIIVMAVERLMALVRPFTVKHSCLNKYPKRIIFMCFFVNVIFFIPYPMNFQIGSFVNSENRTEYFIMYKPESAEMMGNFTFAHTIINNYIPGVIILGVNIAIPIAFSRILKRRMTTLQMQLPQNNQQTKVTLAVLCITVMYFLFNLPDLFIKTLSFIDPGYSMDGEYSLSFWLFMDFTNVFTYLNAANDFVIYILVSDHYRRIFKALYCRCLSDTKGDAYVDSEMEPTERTGVSEVTEKY